VVIQWYIARIG